MAKQKEPLKPLPGAEVMTAATRVYTPTESVKTGWNLYNDKKYPEAIQSFEKALEEDPQDSDALYGLALALKASGQTKKAIETFEKTIKVMETIDDRVRALMLERLARGQIAQLKIQKKE